jgi:hypothetical protein
MSATNFSGSSVDVFDSIQVPRDTTMLPNRKRKASAENNAALRRLARPWCEPIHTPVSSARICSPSWWGFDASEASTASSANMTASVLCAPRGTTPDFNPPLFERVNLQVDQSPIECGNYKPERARGFQRRRSPLRNNVSWETVQSEAITFRKRAIPTGGSNTSSLLTESLKSESGAGLGKQEKEMENPIGIFAKGIQGQKYSASMLPSAFDSDSEDEMED